MTVREFLLFVARIKGLPRSKQKSSLSKTLERCGLTDVPDRLISNLSRGYRQRVGIAQALIHDPEVLILDEPTIGLDPKQIIEVRQLIKDLSGEHTVILSTHILQEATALCERVIIIHQGRIRAIDSPEQLSAKMRQSEKISITTKNAPEDALESLKKLPHVINVLQESHPEGQTFVVESGLGSDIREELSSHVVQNNWGLLELKEVSMTLEDVFIELTQEEALTEEEA